MGCAGSHEAVQVDQQAGRQQQQQQKQISQRNQDLLAEKHQSGRPDSAHKSGKKSAAGSQAKSVDAATSQSSARETKKASLHDSATPNMQHKDAGSGAPAALPPNLTGARKTFVSGASPGSVHSAYQLGCTLGEKKACREA